MKTLMILTSALAIAIVNGFSAPTAYAQAACSGISNACRVFVTSTPHDGDLEGLAGADAICNELASAANLTGTYRAWLADAGGSPSTDFDQSTAPYVRTDGVVVANNYADLTGRGTDANDKPRRGGISHVQLGFGLT